MTHFVNLKEVDGSIVPYLVMPSAVPTGKVHIGCERPSGQSLKLCCHGMALATSLFARSAVDG
jgi:hypothetical protein